MEPVCNWAPKRGGVFWLQKLVTRQILTLAASDKKFARLRRQNCKREPATRANEIRKTRLQEPTKSQTLTLKFGGM